MKEFTKEVGDMILVGGQRRKGSEGWSMEVGVAVNEKKTVLE